MQNNNSSVNGNGAINSYLNQNDGFDFKYLVAKVVGNWRWFALSLVVCLAFGVLYILYAIPSFTVTARVLVNGQNANKIQSGTTETDMLRQLSLFAQESDVNNELQQLHSRSLIEQAMYDLQYNVSYWGQGDIKFAETYKKSPFFINLLELRGGLDNPLAWDVRINKDKVKFMDDYVDTSFTLTWGDTAKLKFCTFVLEKNPDVTINNPNLPLGLKIAPYNATYFQLSSNLLTFLSAENTTSVDVTLNASVPQKGEDFVNHLIELYVQRHIYNNNLVADSTISFINARIDRVKEELSGVETGIENFQKQNKLTDIQEAAKAYVGESSNTAQVLANKEAQIIAVQGIERYLNDQTKNDMALPTSALIEDQTYISYSEKYNNLQQQRLQLLTYSSEQNPAVKSIDAQLASIRASLLKTLRTYEETLQVQKANLENQNSNVQVAMQKMPTQQRQYLEASRRQDVLQQLYVYLLTVREQTQVAKSNNIAPITVIDAAKASVYPYWPNKLIVIVASIFIGILIPSVVILLNELSNNKVTTPNDIVSSTTAPIIAEISQSKSSSPIVVRKESRTAVAEQFRTLRTNLLFKLTGTNNKVIMLTSTMSGEGKSFITLNLAVAMALSGKKTLLLDMELRKGQLSQYLGLDNKIGIADYLERNASLSDVIMPSGINENLWVLTSGELESNPSETLLNSKMSVFFEEMRRKFDYIIMDTPPAPVVTDALVVGLYADLTLYVVRQKYTYKKHIDVIEDLKVNNKLKNIYVILNDIKPVPGYNAGYGFGFRLDDDLGYYHKEDRFEKMPLIKRIFPEV
jgi:capsular exopolysaccharide synthesis family protein